MCLMFYRWYPGGLKLDQMESFQHMTPEGGTQLGHLLEVEQSPASKLSVE